MLIRTLLLACCLCFSVNAALAQLQNNQWRFGNGGGISFNSSPPTFVAGSAIATFEGSASVADRATGNLLFYSDGVTVWGANNLPMPNGTGLLGGTVGLQSSTTAAVIVPVPGNANRYYLFTIDEQASNNGLRYNVIDMSLNGGFGDVVAGQKNIALFLTGSEKLQVVPNSTNDGYWVVTHDLPGNTFFAFAVTSTGVSTTPVSSTLGGVHGNGAGHMKFNRQFNRLAMGNFFTNQIELFDFNNATGQFSNFVGWTHSFPQNVFYGVEFSPDGSKLYVSNLSQITQYDISSGTSATIAATAFVVVNAVFGQIASLQLGPDHRIYINNGNIDVIACPDNAGASCGYQPAIFNTQASGGGYGLPTWVYYNTDMPRMSAANGIVQRDSCVESGSFFSLADTTKILSVSWNFGDPTTGTNNTATGFNVSHVFSGAGTFTVTATLTTACGNRVLTLPANLIRCSQRPTGIRLVGDSCDLTSDLGFDLVGASNSTSPSFFWRFGDPASGTNDTLTVFAGSGILPQHRFSAPGNYQVCVRFQEPGAAPDSLCIDIQVGLCCEFELELAADCVESLVRPRISGNSTIDSIRWDFGAPGIAGNLQTSLAPDFQYTEPGAYRVQALVYSVCGVDTLSENIELRACAPRCSIFAPNAITPNGDGLNDGFLPTSSCEFVLYDLQIYNRWGQQLFRSNDPAQAWDGFFRGELCEGGQYQYVLLYKFALGEQASSTGPIRLLR